MFLTTLELIQLIGLVQTGSYIMANVVSVVPRLLCLKSRKIFIPVDKAYENDQGQVTYRGNLQSFQSTYAASLTDNEIASWC